MVAELCPCNVLNNKKLCTLRSHFMACGGVLRIKKRQGNDDGVAQRIPRECSTADLLCNAATVSHR